MMFAITKLLEFSLNLLLSGFLVSVVLFRWMSILLLATNTGGKGVCSSESGPYLTVFGLKMW